MCIYRWRGSWHSQVKSTSTAAHYCDLTWWRLTAITVPMTMTNPDRRPAKSGHQSFWVTEGNYSYKYFVLIKSQINILHTIFSILRWVYKFYPQLSHTTDVSIILQRQLKNEFINHSSRHSILLLIDILYLDCLYTAPS